MNECKSIADPARKEGRLNAVKIGKLIDRDLLDKVAAGDREALRELYIIYHRRLAQFVRRGSSGGRI